MIFISSHGVNEVPVEARVFLGTVVAFVVFLFLFFIYLNKKLCFHQQTGYQCCHETTPTKFSSSLEKDTNANDDAKDRRLSPSSYNDGPLRPKESAGFPTYQSCQQHNYHQLAGLCSKSSAQFSNRDIIRQAKSPKEDTVRDLISLAEKGRASYDISGNVIISSSSGSSSGSTTSGDDDLLNHRTLRHRDPRGYRQMSPTKSPYQVGFVSEDLLLIAEEALITKCGSLEAGLSYDLPTRTLTVHILQAKELPTNDRGHIISFQVRLMILPSRKQRQKTKIRTGENPQFNEAFIFTKICPEDVQQLGIRLRLTSSERMRRERIVGETIVPLVSADMNNSTWFSLKPRAIPSMQSIEDRMEVTSLPRSNSTGSTNSVHGGPPELLLGLNYNGTTGRLSVEIIKGSHFRNSDDLRNRNIRAPDSYVKLLLTSSSGNEIASSKTSVKKGQPSPLYKETFMFQVALFQLPDVTLMMSVYTKRSMKRKELLGWFSLGLNNSGAEENSHWNIMRDSRGEQICRWHMLLES